LSSFLTTKLDYLDIWSDTERMKSPQEAPHLVARLVRQRIERGGDRLWRHQDFGDMPFVPVAKTLSRLAEAGTIERVSKGVYYRPRTTPFGKSLPNTVAVQHMASDRNPVFPSGVAAAGMLGFTTQTARRYEVATTAGSLPRKLMGQDAVIHTRRPAAWAALTDTDAALLDFLRRGGRTSELTPNDTIVRTLALFSERGRFARLLKTAPSEPPRVRALLGAIGEAIGATHNALTQLRRSLNPSSRFDFGLLTGLPAASQWQARARRP
jgi:hypothetical protein